MIAQKIDEVIEQKPVIKRRREVKIEPIAEIRKLDYIFNVSTLETGAKNGFMLLCGSDNIFREGKGIKSFFTNTYF